jgi:hypothetical protein
LTTYEASYTHSARSYSDEALVERARLVRDAIRAKEAPDDLTQFSRYVFGIEPNPPAVLWLQALEAVERGEIRKLCVVAPPGHAKSTYHSIVFPTWYLGRHPNRSLIGVTTTDTLGRLYGDTVRTTIEQSEKFRVVFPDVEPDKPRGWSQDGFFVRSKSTARFAENKDASMVVVGAGGPVIGRRADGVIVDDAVDEATARSETLLESRKLWIKRSVFSRLKPRGWRIVAGTLWAEGDVVDTAMQSGEYVVIHVKAVSPGREVDADVWVPNGVKWRPSDGVKVGEDDLAQWTG